jgi:hypothetical protein
MEISCVFAHPGVAPMLPIGQMISYRADNRFAYIVVDGKERKFFIVSERRR